MIIALGVIVCIAIVYGSHMIKTALHEETDIILKTEKVRHAIRYNDEILTMSARMAAFTGDLKWQERYQIHEEKLDEAIKTALEIMPIGSEKTDDANMKLIAIENRAFELVEEGNLQTAQNLLMSNEYQDLKTAYTEGLNVFYNKAAAIAAQHHEEHDRVILMMDVIAVLGVLFITLSVSFGYNSLSNAYRQQKAMEGYQRMATLGRFYAGIAHEVNNALQPILGYSDILRMRLEKHTNLCEETEKADVIYERAVYIREIVENILAHTKGVQSQQTKQHAIDVFTKSLEMAEASKPEDITFSIDLSALQPNDHISINQTDITQVVKNLTRNATQAMQNKGEIIAKADRVTLLSRHAEPLNICPGQYCTLAITDQGHGMDKKTAAQIFDPFFTTKPEGDGTGLGLSMCFGIMQQMNGAITLDTTPGKGTTFTLYVPLLD